MLKTETKPPSMDAQSMEVAASTGGACSTISYNFLNPPAQPLALRTPPKKAPTLHRFPISLHSREFKKTFYPECRFIFAL